MDLPEKHTVGFQKTPIRLQEYGVGIFGAITTKSALKKALKQARILVNGKVASTATFIYGKEVIELKPLQIVQPHRTFNCALQVIYEDDYLAAVYKPAGILVSGNRFKTIANALEHHIKKSSQKDAVQPKPVHRLDFPTTGILLIGKTASSILKLNQLFEKKEITKVYRAVTIGAMPQEGVIDELIDEKTASSHYVVLKTVSSTRFGYLNLVDLNPATGRRHQLRKHMFSLGNPILGDATYTAEKQLLKGKGLYLHAFSVSFKHPFTTEEIHLVAPLPVKYDKIFV